jgi:hypothetical protein
MVEPTSIRLEEKMLTRIKEEAKQEGRSTSKQIEYMIRQYYDLKKILTNK